MKKGRDILSFKEVRDILPHRYPFLLIDRVIKMEKDKRVVAIKNVTGNESFFIGHFPNEPVMPGVLIIEAMAQASYILLINDENKRDNKLYFFGTITKFRFLKPVYPGDQLRIEIEVVKKLSTSAMVKAKAMVDDNIVAKGALLFGAV